MVNICRFDREQVVRHIVDNNCLQAFFFQLMYCCRLDCLQLLCNNVVCTFNSNLTVSQRGNRVATCGRVKIIVIWSTPNLAVHNFNKLGYIRIDLKLWGESYYMAADS